MCRRVELRVVLQQGEADFRELAAQCNEGGRGRRISPSPFLVSLRRPCQQPVASEIIATLEQQTTVVVGHYWSNRLLLGHLTGRSFEESVRADDYKPRNVSAYRLVGSVIDAALRVDAVEWAHPGAQEVIR